MGGKSKEAEFETYRLRIYPWVREIPEDEEGWRREGYAFVFCGRTDDGICSTSGRRFL